MVGFLSVDCFVVVPGPYANSRFAGSPPLATRSLIKPCHLVYVAIRKETT